MKKIPVVVVLGHIDHGKTSLLSYIKKDFAILKKESGGITQHIGAYEVEFEGKKITFIDTPGHEAFSEMRSRGAKVADIAILVVAVDEGVKPQTKEAIRVIQESKVPAIVALNKIDKEEANPQKVKGELQKQGVLIEEYGGDMPCVGVSAKTGQGISDLLSTINLVADVLDLKAEIEKSAKGVVIESYLDSFRGAIATLILEEGKLGIGDIVGTQTTVGKLKSIQDSKLENKKEILPGEVGIVTGFEEAPGVGDSFRVFDSFEEAKNNIKISKDFVPFESLNGVEKFFNIVLKADVKGSMEVLEKILRNLKEGKIGVRILRKGVGNITDSDIREAGSEHGAAIGFRVGQSLAAKSFAQQRKVKVFNFEVIYELIDSVQKLMRELKERRKQRVDLARLRVLVIFKTKKRGEKNYRQVVGSRVLTGDLHKGDLIDIEREGEILPGGKIMDLQIQKREIKKAKEGEEIGILYEGKTKIKEEDGLVVYKYEIVE